METHHADICAEHDEAYMKRIWAEKVRSDFVVAQRLAERGCITLAYASVPYLCLLGTAYWWWKKIKLPHTA
jgi:hypothetical protein